VNLARACKLNQSGVSVVELPRTPEKANIMSWIVGDQRTMNPTEEFTVRFATDRDCEEICRLIKELAIYEKLEDQCKMTPELLRRDGFGCAEGGRTYYRCLVAEPRTPSPHMTSSLSQHTAESDTSHSVRGVSLIGYALFFDIYSTFVGRSIHVEVLYVTPEYRGRGVRRRFIATLAKIALDEQCQRIDFSVLSWNTKSIEFYEKLDAINLTECEGWQLFRLNRTPIERIAANDSPPSLQH